MSTEKIPFRCGSTRDCNGHGQCTQNNDCNCDFGWFNENCTQNLKLSDFQIFWSYRAFFIAINLILLVICYTQLRARIKKNNEQRAFFSFWKFLIHTIISPVNISMFLIICQCGFKMAHLAIDPFLFNGIIDREVERLLGEVVYSFLYTIYAVIVVVWYTMYDDLSYTISKFNNDSDGSTKPRPRKCIWGIFKASIKLRVIFVFMIQIVTSIVKSNNRSEEYSYYTLTAYGVLYVNLILFIVQFFTYGILVYKCIEEQEQINERIAQDSSKMTTIVDNKQDDKVTLINNKNQHHGIIIQKININNNDQQQEKIIEISQETNRKMKELQEIQRKVFDFQQFYNNTTSVGNQNQIEDFENSMILSTADLGSATDWQINQTNQKIVSLQVNQDVGLVVNQIIDKIDAMQQKQSTYRRMNLQITEEEDANEDKPPAKGAVADYNFQLSQMRQQDLSTDQKVLQKIGFIIIFGVFFLLCFAVLTAISFGTDYLKDQQWILIIIILSSSLQFLASVFIFKLFSNVNSKELDILRWITSVGQSQNLVNYNFLFAVQGSSIFGYNHNHIPLEQYAENQNDQGLQNLLQRINMTAYQKHQKFFKKYQKDLQQASEKGKSPTKS